MPHLQHPHGGRPQGNRRSPDRKRDLRVTDSSTQTQDRFPLSRPAFWLLLLLFTLVWFGTLNYRHLIASDEGRYAEMAREMLVSGDWITPRYDGYKYFEKPPLQTWMNALTFMWFGLGEWQARLWTALTGFGGTLLAGYTAKRVFNARTGLMTVLVLVGAPMWGLLGHFNVLDMGVTFMMEISLCAMLLAQRPQLPRAQVRRWMWLCWAGMALAVLSKGLIGIVLPGGVLVLYSLIARDWAVWKRAYIVSGLLIFLAISAPWFILVSIHNPEFAYFFFVDQHFKRFLTDYARREGPFYYFVPVLLVGFLPWVSVMWQTAAFTRKMPRQPNGFAPVTLLWVWTGFIFVFFSISSSKLISYILPIAPALAMLIGLYLSQLTAERFKRHLAGYAVLLVLVTVLTAIFGARHGSAKNPLILYQEFRLWLYAAYAAAMFGIVLAWRLNRHSVRRALIAFSAGMFALAMIGGSGHEVFGRNSSGVLLVPAVKKVMARLGPDTPFYSVGMLDHTMPFYLRHTMTMVAFEDELAFGISQEPQKWIPTIPAFIKRWDSEPKALALISPPIYENLKNQHVPMQVIARDARRVIVEKPQP
ncbi:MAG: glycosyltransferase family 39 protein [Burkholderiales bacterium]|nr:glycosyltransferase family 39 protein [Burkholderiales bacterium]